MRFCADYYSAAQVDRTTRRGRAAAENRDLTCRKHDLRNAVAFVLSHFLSCTDRSVKRRAWPWRSAPFEAFTFYCDYVFPPQSRWCMVSDLRLRQVAAKKFMAAAFCRGLLARHQRHQSFIPPPPPEYRHYHYPLCSLALLREVERGMAGRRREGLGWLLPSFVRNGALRG